MGEGSSSSLQPSCLSVTPWLSLPHPPLLPIHLITCVYNLFQQKVKEMSRCGDE